MSSKDFLPTFQLSAETRSEEFLSLLHLQWQIIFVNIMKIPVLHLDIDLQDVLEIIHRQLPKTSLLALTWSTQINHVKLTKPQFTGFSNPLTSIFDFQFLN